MDHYVTLDLTDLQVREIMALLSQLAPDHSDLCEVPSIGEFCEYLIDYALTKKFQENPDLYFMIDWSKHE